MKRLYRLLVTLLVMIAPGCLVVTCGTTHTFEPDERQGGGSKGEAAVDSSRESGSTW